MALRREFHVTVGLFASLNLIGYRNVSITGGFRLEQQIRILPSDSKGACHRNHRTGRHHRIKHVCRTENGRASLADSLRDRRLDGGAVTHEGLDAAGDQYDTYSHERRGHGRRRTGLHDSRAHTLMSAGAMVAGGLAFTIPGLWMMSPGATFPLHSLIALSIVGAVLGTLFTTICG